MKPANAKTGDVIHSIEVPERFAHVREHYLRGFMKGYLGAAEKRATKRTLEAKWNAQNKAFHAERKPESRLARRLRRGVD
jgi:hypothetical protein